MLRAIQAISIAYAVRCLKGPAPFTDFFAASAGAFTPARSRRLQSGVKRRRVGMLLHSAGSTATWIAAAGFDDGVGTVTAICEPAEVLGWSYRECCCSVVFAAFITSSRSDVGALELVRLSVSASALPNSILWFSACQIPFCTSLVFS